ncbi:MAG TPA: ACP S-malonyltransferase [Candidatus Babeliales bacterium]|nr:ACP S-malonyltransferase [Candidatus Babeliales bacterium]
MKTALLFPGYGSQFVGMGKELYDEYRIVQEYFEEAAHILNTNFVKLCFASSDAELSKLSNAYTSLFLVSASIYAILKEHDIHPDIVAGYNNGETAALFAASSLSLPDGLYLLNKFCSFYQEYIDNKDVDAMMVHGIDTAQLEKMCDQLNNQENKAFVAVYNSHVDNVVAGSRNTLSALQDMIDGHGTVEYVGAEVGLHSPLMNEVVDQFKDFLEKVDFKDVKIPLLSSLDGAVVTAGSDIKERFIRHINSALEWYEVIKALKDYDCIIIAPSSKKLHEMIEQQYPKKTIVSIAKKEDIEKLKEIINKE